MAEVQAQLIAALQAKNPEMVQNFLHNCQAYGQVRQRQSSRKIDD
jgi:hypothetical protein